jgi:hypothetical protein
MENKIDKYADGMVPFHNEFLVHWDRKDLDDVIDSVEHHEMNMSSYRRDPLEYSNRKNRLKKENNLPSICR